jgi:protein involved in polysaccharide export with SLBB domain
MSFVWRSFWAISFAVLGAIFVTGCASSGTSTNAPGGGGGAGAPVDFSIDKIYAGDQLRIVYSDTPVTIPATEVQVPETGKVLIHMGEEISVAGRKADDVAKEIRTLFIETKNLYRRMNVTVQVLGRSVSVGGEVKAPGSFAFEANITVLKAINRAGGFTEFANRRDVLLTRLNGQQVYVDCKKAQRKPALDLVMYPGDRLQVNRGVFRR